MLHRPRRGPTELVQRGQGSKAADKMLAEQASLKLSDFPAGWTSQPPSNDVAATIKYRHEPDSH
jgi:hypothetical protein